MGMATGQRMRAQRRTDHDGPLDRLQLGLALSTGKLTANAGRLLRVGGGTSLPDIVARRIDPCVLRGTYLHGPVLPKNPWFTDHLIWQGLGAATATYLRSRLCATTPTGAPTRR